MRELRTSTSSWGRDWSLAYLLDMELLYHSFVQCLRTVQKNDTLTYFGFGLREGSPIILDFSNLFRVSNFCSIEFRFLSNKLAKKLSFVVTNLLSKMLKIIRSNGENAQTIC